MNKYALSSIVLALMSARVNADDLDLTSALNAALFKNRSTISWPAGGIIVCHADGSEDISGPYVAGGHIHNGPGSCDITFSNVRFKNVSVDYSNVKISPLPDGVQRKVFYYRNCGTSPVIISDTDTLEYTTSVTISNSTTVFTGRSDTIDAKITIPIDKASLGVTAADKVTFNKTDESSKTSVDSAKEQYSVKLDIPALPAKILHEVVLQVKLQNGYFEFSGKFELDADVFLQDMMFNARHPKVAVGKLSSFTPNVSDRTVAIKGEVWNVTGRDQSRTDYDLPLAEAQCAPPQEASR